jgi:hypothetical protein
MTPEQVDQVVVAHPVRDGDIKLSGPYLHTPDGFNEAINAYPFPLYFGHGETVDKATADAIAKAVNAENNTKTPGKNSF